jgi:hypothetical protein
VAHPVKDGAELPVTPWQVHLIDHLDLAAAIALAA